MIDKYFIDGKINLEISLTDRKAYIKEVQKDIPWVTSLYHIKWCKDNNTTIQPTCRFCESPVLFKREHRDYCPDCKNLHIQEKREQTMLERYGVANASHLDSRKEVMKRVNKTRAERLKRGEIQVWNKGLGKKKEVKIRTPKKPKPVKPKRVVKKVVKPPKPRKVEWRKKAFKQLTEKVREVFLNYKGFDAFLPEHNIHINFHSPEQFEQLLHSLDQQDMTFEYKLLVYDRKPNVKRLTSLLNSNPCYISRVKYNEVILPFVWKIFYKKELVLWADDDIRRRLYQNRIAYLCKREHELTDIQLLQGFSKSLIHKGFSSFSPQIIKSFIEEYNIQSIYDPCGGWGHRLIGAWNIDYHYNDNNPELMASVSRMYEEYKKSIPSGKKTFSSQDASTYKPDLHTNAVFTCPPYYNTEDYDYAGDSVNLVSSYEEWLNVWWKGLVECAKKVALIFAYVISEKYVEDMNKVLEECGYRIDRKIIVTEGSKNHLSVGAREYLIVATIII